MPATESHVVDVRLYEGVTLDIRGLMEYSGQGKCRVVVWDVGTMATYGDNPRIWAKATYSDNLMIWAKSRNWEFTEDKYATCFYRNP